MDLTETKEWMRKLTIELALKIAGRDELKIVFKERWRRTHGRCTTLNSNPNYTPTIAYSIPFIEVNLHLPTALRFLVIHEVCHLVHPNHGYLFERLCRQNGLDSRKGAVSLATHTIEPKGDWIAKCPTCNRTHYKFSQPKRQCSCYYCSNSYNSAHELIFSNPSRENANIIKQITQGLKRKSDSEIIQIQTEENKNV